MNYKLFLADESGVAAIEYGLTVALISVAIIASITFLGHTLSNTFSLIATTMQGR